MTRRLPAVQPELATARLRLRALVAAEGELGPLFALVERGAAGALGLGEMTALFWHCLSPRDDLTRDAVGEAVVAVGLVAASAPLRVVLGQILQGDAGPPAA